MKKSTSTFLKHPTKDNVNRSANPPVTRASTILFKTMQEMYQHELKIKKHKKITVKDIQLEVSKYYNLQFHELCSKNRSRYISKPRQIAMFLSKQLTDSSYPEIGKLFGGKDHATVIHGVNKIKVLSETDRKIKQDLDNRISSLKVD